MKIAADFSDELLAAVDRLAAARLCSRDAVIRDAVAAYITEHRDRALNDAFGLWGDREVDGLECQRKLREEW